LHIWVRISFSLLETTRVYYPIFVLRGVIRSYRVGSWVPDIQVEEYVIVRGRKDPTSFRAKLLSLKEGESTVIFGKSVQSLMNKVTMSVSKGFVGDAKFSTSKVYVIDDDKMEVAVAVKVTRSEQ